MSGSRTELFGKISALETNLWIGKRSVAENVKCYLHEITQPQHPHAPEICLRVFSLET